MASPISYDSMRNQISSQNFNPNLTLTKSMNSVGFGAIYDFYIGNGALRILYTYRIYVRFHSAVASKLNK